MAENPFPYRQTTYFLVTNALLFGAICVLAQRTGRFDLRILCEAFSASYLVFLTTWAWLSALNIVTRLLLTAAAMVLVVFGCKFALADGFASWFEVALWYVPVTSVLCGGIRLSGFKIEWNPGTKVDKTFSIRSIMVATTMVALLFAVAGTLTRSRAGGQLDSILWLTDALVIVVPVSIISAALVCIVLSNKLFHASALLLVAPLSGILICQIWNWDQYQATVLLTTTIAALTAALTFVLRAIGFQLVKRQEAT